MILPRERQVQHWLKSKSLSFPVDLWLSFNHHLPSNQLQSLSSSLGSRLRGRPNSADAQENLTNEVQRSKRSQQWCDPKEGSGARRCRIQRALKRYKVEKITEAIQTYS